MMRTRYGTLVTLRLGRLATTDTRYTPEKLINPRKVCNKVNKCMSCALAFLFTIDLVTPYP